MNTYRAPGVYVEERSLLPPSVAEVATALPAFIGYTEKAGDPQWVRSFEEFKQKFGGPEMAKLTVKTEKVQVPVNGGTESKERQVLDSLSFTDDKAPRHFLYYAVRHYFDNGRGKCLIVSIGTYRSGEGQDSASSDASGIATEQQGDSQQTVEPTDTQQAASSSETREPNGTAASDSASRTQPAAENADGRGADSGAKTKSNDQGPASAKVFKEGLTKAETFDDVTLLAFPEASKLLDKDDYYSICQAALSQCKRMGNRFALLDAGDSDKELSEEEQKQFRTGIGDNHLSFGAAYYPYLKTTLRYEYEESGVDVAPPDSDGSALAEEAQAEKQAENGQETEEASRSDSTETPGDANGERTQNTGVSKQGVTTKSHKLNDKEIRSERATLYNEIKAKLAAWKELRVTLPPSPAVAGVYVATDRERGVWKAPANVNLNSVIEPVFGVTAAQHGELNDDDSGKAINVIRTISGRGVLVYGARTLAGSDNEWRYVPVRRLFLTVEESVKRASAFAVFEANDASTWVKVKGMIEGYLYGLWEKGALMGSTPEAAYRVQVGLGSTMTAQDVLDGKLIVQVEIAPVRPAEFIILRFTHKMLEP